MIFKHLKVIELASVLAGPSVGMFFAELGAQVIKIENAQTGGDVTRKWRLPTEPANHAISAYYCCVNWHKKVCLLNLKRTDDQQKVYALVQEADIIIANFKTGAAQKLGMDYATLQAINPKIIYGDLTAFGKNNSRTAFDVVLQAESGFMYMTGEPNGQVVKMPVALIDILAGHQLKEGILVALIKRMQTGKGSYVSVSLMESAIASLANQATNWLMAKHIPQKMGTLHPNIAPYGELFACKDKKEMVLAVGNDKQFRNLCIVLEKEDWAKDGRFLTNNQRIKHRKELYELLKMQIVKQERTTLLQKLLTRQVPAGAIHDMSEVFDLPIAQNMILTETLADGTQTQRVKTVVFVIEN